VTLNTTTSFTVNMDSLPFRGVSVTSSFPSFARHGTVSQPTHRQSDQDKLPNSRLFGHLLFSSRLAIPSRVPLPPFGPSRHFLAQDDQKARDVASRSLCRPSLGACETRPSTCRGLSQQQGAQFD
jgi:hypothetical protein